MSTLRGASGSIPFGAESHGRELGLKNAASFGFQSVQYEIKQNHSPAIVCRLDCVDILKKHIKIVLTLVVLQAGTCFECRFKRIQLVASFIVFSHFTYILCF